MLPETFSDSVKKVLKFLRFIGISIKKLPEMEIVNLRERPHTWGEYKEKENKIVINLHSPDKVAFEVTLAHELFHYWVRENKIDIPKEINEFVATFIHVAYARITYGISFNLNTNEPYYYKMGKLFGNYIERNELLKVAKELVNYIRNTNSY